MLAHVPADRQHVYLMSIMRDSWVEVPGHGRAKINAAYSWGGVALTTETVEQLLDIRIDHVAEIDFAGFEDMTDALGGVTVDSPGRSQHAATTSRPGRTGSTAPQHSPSSGSATPSSTRTTPASATSRRSCAAS